MTVAVSSLMAQRFDVLVPREPTLVSGTGSCSGQKEQGGAPKAFGSSERTFLSVLSWKWAAEDAIGKWVNFTGGLHMCVHECVYERAHTHTHKCT